MELLIPLRVVGSMTRVGSEVIELCARFGALGPACWSSEREAAGARPWPWYCSADLGVRRGMATGAAWLGGWRSR